MSMDAELKPNPDELPDDPAFLKPLVVQLFETLQSRERRIQQLEHHMDLLLRRVFGKSSEKLRGGDDVSYFNDAGEYNAYFQEMASTLDNLFKPDSILRSSPEKFEEYSTWEGFKELAKKNNGDQC